MARAPMIPPQAAASQQIAPDPEMEQGAAPAGDDADMEQGEQQAPPAKKMPPKHHEKKRKPASERLYGKKKSAHRHG